MGDWGDAACDPAATAPDRDAPPVLADARGEARWLREQLDARAIGSLHRASAVARTRLMSMSQPDRSQRVAGRTV